MFFIKTCNAQFCDYTRVFKHRNIQCTQALTFLSCFDEVTITDKNKHTDENFTGKIKEK